MGGGRIREVYGGPLVVKLILHFADLEYVQTLAAFKYGKYRLREDSVDPLTASPDYSLTLSDYDNDERYNKFNLTSACWEMLMDIAQKWCDYRNSIREYDKKVELNVEFFILKKK